MALRFEAPRWRNSAMSFARHEGRRRAVEHVEAEQTDYWPRATGWWHNSADELPFTDFLDGEPEHADFWCGSK
jgi:hypothetical protein